MISIKNKNNYSINRHFRELIKSLNFEIYK